MDMNINHINPFLVATKSVLRDMCQIDLTAGTPYVKKEQFNDDSVVICLGVTGQIKGQVLLALSTVSACAIASKMCMMPITALDELSLSALCELGNMVFGNAATVLSTKGTIIDITPPTVIQGNFTIANNFAQNVCIPFKFDGDKTIEVDVSVKEA